MSYKTRYKNGSIIHPDYVSECCYLCKERGDYSAKRILHKHLIFMGPLRKISEREGFFAWLCPDCHILGAHAVHRDYAVCRKLQQAAQRRYEIDHTREEFIELIGRSYL